MFRKASAIAFGLFLILCVSFQGCLASENADSVIPMRYTHVADIRAGLAINGSQAQCFGLGKCRDRDTTTTLKVTLQKRLCNTSRWSAVCTWRDVQSGTATAGVTMNRAIRKGYDYRVYVSCAISDSDGVVLEIANAFSKVINYPAD